MQLAFIVYFKEKVDNQVYSVYTVYVLDTLCL